MSSSLDKSSLAVPITPGTPRTEDRLNPAEVDDEAREMGYQQTLMYGKYSRSLGDQIKEEAKRQKMIDKRRRKEYRRRRRELSGRGECYQRTAKVVTFIWTQTFARIGEDWVFLALLGMIMALVSFMMDYCIVACGQARLRLVEDLVTNVPGQFVAWVTLPVLLVLFSAGFVHVVAPQAIGSGIPEMKTILRGVVLKEYLTFRTLLAKAVGLTCTLGSGMPLGKEGPFVHIASIVATLLTKLVTSFQGIYENESRNSEMLAAACAVGVACCFGSPIGGVLFSIEVTSVYFAVRNYWRGFFAAVCGAVVFRLLSIWFEDEDTIVAVFKTGFAMDFPYDPQELLVFAMIGVCCGLGGSLYVYLHRRYVLWMRANKQLTRFLQKNRFIYPFFISALISALTFPAGPGKFQAADLTTHEQIETLFSNYTWTNDDNLPVDEYNHVKHWKDPWTKSIFVNLAVYILSTFFLSILASTLPVPTGVLIPSFKVGAAFGRLVGEAMHVWFPEGVRPGDVASFILPGGYATVGAAAFSGAVTHTISISVIVFEMTGQITHCVPVLIAVLISNAIASLLQPSCYDSIILIKKLPYLPDILPSSSGAYNYYVDDMMVKDVKYIWYGMSYKDLRQALKDGRKLRGFPLVDNPSSMILLGSIQRGELIHAIEKHIGKDKRAAYLVQKRKEEQEQRLREQMEEEERERIKQLEGDGEVKNTVKKVASTTFFVAESDIGAAAPSTAPGANGRRPSRFTVSTAVDQNPPEIPTSTETLDDSPASKAMAHLNRGPKSILKKNSSVTIHNLPSAPPSILPQDTYQTVSGASDRWRNTVHSVQQMFKKNSQFSSKASLGFGWDFDERGSGKRVTMFGEMTLEEQKQWEKEEMDKSVNFSDMQIDPAPFQLVEKTSLLKVHSLFSMLGVNHAYVTAIGRLIGVVGLKELRKSIEDANAGGVAKKDPSADLEKGRKHSVKKSHPSTNVTVASMDSAISHSVNSDESEENLIESS